ncbi:FAD-binding oxidoreductase [Alphaproteobacteria bacterium]|nr:FAD-binding oxidoreductase [Alphaproteobacteria bacterium]
MNSINIENNLKSLQLQYPPIFNKMDHEKYVNDWREQYVGKTYAVLRPSNTEEVSNILKFASENNITIVPQGGNTGLCGGATPDKSGNSIIISLEKMNKIRSFNKQAKTITVDAGVILSSIHEKVEQEDLFFPLSLGAKGSCMIGGNLSTNAGGINVLKYGNSRELCLGLEVVLPDGKIMNLLTELKKDNTGYDLKNLFIGAEGTLGIITGATFKLFPLPKKITTFFVEASTIFNALKLLNVLQLEFPGSIESFEIMPNTFWVVAKNNIDNIVMPLEKIPEMGVLVDISSYSNIDIRQNDKGEVPIINKIENILAECLENNLISDATICSNEAQSKALWSIREAGAESEKKELKKSNLIKCLKHDISLPLESIESFHEEAQKMINNFLPNLKTIFFGHLGDGNLHYNVFGNGSLPDGFNGKSIELTEKLYEIVHKYNGSFSAEHGIGQLKKESLKKHKNNVAYSLMQTIKNQIDPKGIMNPGKIL